MKSTTLKTFIALVAALLLAAPLNFADDSKDVDSQLATLRKKFEQRYAQIHSLKQKGIVGETSDGYIDFVTQKDDAAAGLVDEEIADRKELYELIAKKEKTTPEKVAERNAKRNFEKARPGEYLKTSDGKWVKKEK